MKIISSIPACFLTFIVINKAPKKARTPNMLPININSKFKKIFPIKVIINAATTNTDSKTLYRLKFITLLFINQLNLH